MHLQPATCMAEESCSKQYYYQVLTRSFWGSLKRTPFLLEWRRRHIGSDETFTWALQQENVALYHITDYFLTSSWCALLQGGEWCDGILDSFRERYSTHQPMTLFLFNNFQCMRDLLSITTRSPQGYNNDQPLSWIRVLSSCSWLKHILTDALVLQGIPIRMEYHLKLPLPRGRLIWV